MSSRWRSGNRLALAFRVSRVSRASHAVSTALLAFSICACRSEPPKPRATDIADAQVERQAPRDPDDRVAAYRRAVEARVGHPVELTVEPKLQEVVRTALTGIGGKAGTAVVIDVRSGAVRALYSIPNPDGSDPLLSATVPASTYKAFVGLTALQRGLIKEKTEYQCTGTYHSHGETFPDVGKHGPTTVRTALATSCDTFFDDIVTKVGADAVANDARALGLGLPSGIELPEPAGIVPTNAWFSQNKGKANVRDVVETHTGHGDLRITPLQLLRAYNAIATGRLVTIHLVPGEAPSTPVPFKEEDLAAIRAGFVATAREPFGTAHEEEGGAPIDFAGKTGSAHEGDDVLGWFVGYAPAEKPRAAFVVKVLAARRATFTAVPVARKIAAAIDEAP